MDDRQENIKVFFNQKGTHRKRQRETVEYCPGEIEKIIPPVTKFERDIHLTGTVKGFGKLKSLLSRFIPIHFTRISDRDCRNADYIYTWGCIPIGSRRPYIIELDNPYCISYYHPLWLRVFRILLKRILFNQRCHRIVCISEACRQTLIKEFGKKINKKVSVVYPYISDHSTERKIHAYQNKTIEFLFVSSAFYLKGGRELLIAFERAVNLGYNIHLTMVTRMPGDYEEKYRKKKWLTVKEANMDKQVLFKKFFPNADVFIMPSYQDSFGLVYLEALSFGLPIIATDIYAVPEMAVDNYNGFLINNPLDFFMEDYTMNEKYVFRNMSDRIKRDKVYGSVVYELESKICEITDPERIQKFSLNSQKLFKEKFCEEKRRQAFLDIF